MDLLSKASSALSHMMEASSKLGAESVDFKTEIEGVKRILRQAYESIEKSHSIVGTIDLGYEDEGEGEEDWAGVPYPYPE